MSDQPPTVPEVLGIKTAERDWDQTARESGERLRQVLDTDYPPSEVDRTEASKFQHLRR